MLLQKKIFNPQYDDYRAPIEKLIKKGYEWEYIKYFGQVNVEGLQKKLGQLQDDDMIPGDLNSDLWIEIVDYFYEYSQRIQTIEEKIENNRILSRKQDNDLEIPKADRSNWQVYKNKLISQGWTNDSIIDLEKTTISILKKLRLDSDTPIKGLTIGHVQSGKTASMAGLMAMAADWGFNFFIVLSGSIESLRKQTEDRLVRDLKNRSNVSWQLLTQLSLKPTCSHQIRRLVLDHDSHDKYLTVCLKNKTRLNDLIYWLQEDGNKLSQMRILLIDDEADQAGINTNDVNDELAERTAINKAIVELVNIVARNNHKPKSMNYVSYTATPYANFLNEATQESLYPQDFVAILNPANEYFGTKQIFGLENDNYHRGLPIIREISKEEKEIVDHIQKNNQIRQPQSLIDAVNWFLIATSIMRYRKYRRPISMLVHISHKQNVHNIFAEVISSYFRNTSKQEIINSCRELYTFEQSKFTKEDFEMEFENYPFLKEIKEYPPFEKVESELKKLITKYPSHINVTESTGSYQYHDGIHLCIDNSSNNRITEDLEQIRLAYPDPESPTYPTPAPAFIIIGGNTLSRGLTIEGLVSTYFLRPTSQADSLLQMGRFFGYRKWYEMLPRIWMTSVIEKKFKFMASLEEELLQDIETYIQEGMDASEYGPKIKNSPKLSWLKITAKNKSQNAIELDLDFSGTSKQTVLFENNLDIQRQNIKITEEFLNQLEEPKESHNKRGIYWTNVPYEIVKEQFLSNFNFSKQSDFNDMDCFFEWYEKSKDKANFTNWNVVLAGSSNHPEVREWTIGNKSIGLVSRSRRGSAYGEKINIGVLRTPSDLCADMTKEIYDQIPTEYKLNVEGKRIRAEIEAQLDEIDQEQPKKSVIIELRKAANLGLTPQLLLYRIDKNSKFTKKQKPNTKEIDRRHDLNSVEDLIGVSLFIPGYKSGRNLATKLSIRIEDTIVNYNLDEEIE